MIAQSRHAAMGEMISMIAHQWRQPLSMIAMGANNIIADVQLESISEESLLEVSQEILFETDYLSKTIDDFRNFFRPDKDVENVDIESVFDEVFKIMGKSLEANNVTVIKNFHSHKKIKTYSRELLQVLINLVKNAKEALVEHTKKDRTIEISTQKEDKKVIITVKDNAGGIGKDIIDKIFEPYFSTKDEKNGTGLGLYMSKTIVEKHLQGSIKATNHSTGVTFELELPFKIGEVINV
jgi:C4-dicarboxylate-specific signal transduction histidine kinase